MTENENTWTEVDAGLMPDAEKLYTSTRHGGEWWVALVDDVIHRYVLILSGRRKVWPLLHASAPLERVFAFADSTALENQSAGKA